VTSPETYQQELTGVTRRALALVLALFDRTTPLNAFRHWPPLVATATAVMMAAQTVAAEMGGPYVAAALGEDLLAEVAADGFAGTGSGGYDLTSLLTLPLQGWTGEARWWQQARNKVAMYTETAVTDAGRQAAGAATAASHAAGYYRRLRLPSCARCAILAGRFYRWNSGFRRHPRCDCTHVPVHTAGDGSEFDPRQAVLDGHVRGLSAANTEAIRLGADPAQVVNAQSGMYTAGGYQFTRTGTSRRAIGGARILAKALDQSLGWDTADKTYTNLTVDRYLINRYAALFRRGTTHTRITSTGREQRYAYRFAATPRPTADQIITTASSRAEAIRLLTNYGYLI